MGLTYKKRRAKVSGDNCVMTGNWRPEWLVEFDRFYECV